MVWAINATRYSRIAPLYSFFLGRLKRDPLLLAESENHIVNIYFDEENAKKQSADEINRVLDNDYAEQYRNETINIVHQVDIFTKKIKSIELKNYGNNELHDLFADFFNFLEKFGEITPRARIIGLEKTKEYLLSKGVDEKDVERVIISLIYPEEKSINLLEEIEFLNLAHAFLLKSHSPSDAIFDEHLKKWAWVPTDWGSGKPWESSDLKLRLSQIKDPLNKIDNINKNRAEQLKEKRRLQSKYQIQGDIAKIFNWIETEAETRLLRRFAISKLLFYSKTLFYELSQRMHLEEDLTHNLINKEIRDFLINNNKPDVKLIGKRSDYFVLLFDNKGEHWLYGDRGRDKIEKNLRDQKQNPTNIENLRGIPTYVGKSIKAPVKIIKSTKDIIKIQEGDILVAKDTTPDFLIVFHKIKGIITDEGGLTCHAGIISREFEMPCIIGTKHATTLLKDGDLVELDTENGIVKKQNQDKTW